MFSECSQDDISHIHFEFFSYINFFFFFLVSKHSFFFRKLFYMFSVFYFCFFFHFFNSFLFGQHLPIWDSFPYLGRSLQILFSAVEEKNITIFVHFLIFHPLILFFLFVSFCFHSFCSAHIIFIKKLNFSINL